MKKWRKKERKTVKTRKNDGMSAKGRTKYKQEKKANDCSRKRVRTYADMMWNRD